MLTRSPHLSPLLLVTALASAGAGVVHAAAAPEHTNWGASVAFFVGLAVFQVGWAAYLLAQRPAPAVLALGAAVNVLSLGIWAVSRVSGLPVGPHRGEAEAAGRADIVASALGVIVVLGAVALARHWGHQPVARLRSALSAGVGGLAVCALSVFALTGVSGHAHLAEGEHGPTSPIDVQVVSTVQDLAPTVEQIEPAASHPDDGHSH